MNKPRHKIIIPIKKRGTPIITLTRVTVNKIPTPMVIKPIKIIKGRMKKGSGKLYLKILGGR